MFEQLGMWHMTHTGLERCALKGRVDVIDGELTLGNLSELCLGVWAFVFVGVMLHG